MTDDDIPDDVRDEMLAERRLRDRRRHYCDLCRGFTGPDSPCYQGEEDDGENDGY